MAKPAENTYPLHPLIRNRWSPRAFDTRPIESGKICAILEAARWAPSCYNEQPWRFFVGAVEINPPTLEKLQTLLMPGNHWALKAPVLILSAAKKTFAHNGQPNRHASHDVGLAAENMVLQALDLGLYAHQMAGFYADKARDLLFIPEDYDPMAMMVIGYLASPDTLEGDLKTRELSPRSRKPLQDMVFSGQWGQGFPICFT